MPQGRIILKSICQSKKLSLLKTDGARLLYTWLIPNLDVNGCFSGDPDVIKGQVFTRLRKSTKTVQAYLENLAEEGLIVLYQNNGDVFLNIPDFEEKQPYLNPSKEGKTAIIPPTPEQLQSNSRVTPPKVKVKVKVKDNIKESKKSFTPPTLEEIDNYIKVKSYDVNAKKFYDYFTESNWVDSKGNKVRNWKQKIITWSGNRNERQKRNPNNRPSLNKQQWDGELIPTS